MGTPSVPMLGAEHAAGQVSSFGGNFVMAGGERGPCGGQQELGLLGGGDGTSQGRLDGGEGVGGQAGGEQHGAAVQGGVRHRHAELGVTGGRVVEVAQCAGQVAAGERDQGPVVPRVGDLEALAGPGEQGLGRGEAGLGPAGSPGGQVGQRRRGAGAGLPDHLPLRRVSAIARRRSARACS